MTGTSSSASSDKPGKNDKDLLLPTVKDEFASSPKLYSLKIEHATLKEKHETLKMDYKSLVEMTKLAEETYEVLKNQLHENRSEELAVANKRLVDDCERERSEKEKYKKIFEEMKAMERERKATLDELRAREHELLMARRKVKEDAEKLDNKFVELGEKVGVIETECSFLKSLFDAEVAAPGTVTPAMSGNELNNDVTSDITGPIMISDKSSEHDNPPREGNSSNGNQALGDTVTPRAANTHLPPFSPLSSSSSSSSSYEVVAGVGNA